MEHIEQQGSGQIRALEGQYGLDYLNLRNINNIYWNLTTAGLYEQIIRRREGLLSHLGPVVVRHISRRLYMDQIDTLNGVSTRRGLLPGS